MYKVARMSAFIDDTPRVVDVTDIDFATYLASNGLQFTTSRDKKGITHFNFRDVPTALTERYPGSDVHQILSLYHSLYRVARFNKTQK